jgi:DNA-binding beta-propeller fold protein YncE
MSRAFGIAVLLAALLLPAQEPLGLVLKAVYESPQALGNFSKTPGLFKRILFGVKEEPDRWVRPMSVARTDRCWLVCDAGTAALWIVSPKERKAVRSVPPGGLIGPVDVVVGKGFAYVSDSEAGAVWSVSLDTFSWTRIPGDFRRPTGLAWCVSEGGRLLITDTQAGAVLAWDGKQTRPVIREGLSFPTDVAELDAETFLVADCMNHEISLWNWKGERTGGFGKAGDGLGNFAFLRGVAVDAGGRIYVSDVQNDWIQVFDRAGKLLTAYGRGGTLNHPSYLTWTGAALWVADTFGRRIVELELK